MMGKGSIEGDNGSIKDAFIQANENRDYSIYTRSMDAALVDKARSIFPHFGEVPENGVIVDAGSGTGALAELAAEEFRGTRVYGLDISHELLERAVNSRALMNIVYGDAAEQNFPDNFIDIKYYSTSGHEIESFGGKGKMKDAVYATFKELKPGGKIIIRDFAKPERIDPIYMRILATTGLDDISLATKQGVIDYNLLSVNTLFSLFHKEFGGGNLFSYERVKVDGQEYIKINPEWAHEFYLRKDYTGNWRQEIHEKYSYWTPIEARRILKNAGFEDVDVIPDPNEYILQNRLLGQIALYDMDSDGRLKSLPFPPTHMVVVGTKPKESFVNTEAKIQVDLAVDYQRLKDSIIYNKETGIVKIDSVEYKVDRDRRPITGSKKTVYFLDGEPPRVLKVVKPDNYNNHAVFKAIFQSVSRENILDQHKIPHARIINVDPDSSPPRYFVQEAVARGSICAADLIKTKKLTRDDVKQIASYVNSFETSKQWQIDTNPFNWYRVTNLDGTTTMFYIDGKVYKYDENWEFRKIGLLQWLNPKYVGGAVGHTVLLPRAKEYEELVQRWANENNEQFSLWKEYLYPILQPSGI